MYLYIYTDVYIYTHTYTYLYRKQFLQEICILNKQTIKWTKTNCNKFSDAKDILNNHDNENEVRFIFVVTASSIFHFAARGMQHLVVRLRRDV